MVDFKEVVRNARSKIRVLRTITTDDSYINCGITSSNEYIDGKVESTNIKIPKILREIFTQYGKHTLIWKIPNKNLKNRLIYAYNIIHATEYFNFGGFQNRNSVKDDDDYFPPFYPQNCSEEDLNFWSQFYILDELYFGKLVLIKPDENGNNHELFLFDHPNTIARLTISLEQYFELTVKTLGLYCWQEYVTEPDYKIDGAIPDYFHENMALLFPEEDLSMFRSAPKLELSLYNRFVAKKDKIDYRAKFIQIMEELKSNPNIEFKYYEDELGYKRDKLPYTANFGVPEVVLRKIKKDYGREIPESMLSFYYQMNGCKVYWNYKNENIDNDFWLNGKVNFLGIEEVMGGKWNDIYLDWKSPELFKDEAAVYYFKDDEAKANPEIAELMRHARIFDQQGEMRDYFIDFVEDQEEPDIYKVERTNYYKMEIDFITFIDARLEFVGISGWEYKFIKEGFNEESKQNWIAEFKENVVKVLPNANFEKFGL